MTLAIEISNRGPFESWGEVDIRNGAVPVVGDLIDLDGVCYSVKHRFFCYESARGLRRILIRCVIDGGLFER